MRKQGKMLAIVMVVLFAILGIVGCGEQQEDVVQPAPAPEAVEDTGEVVEDTGEIYVANVVAHSYEAHNVRERVWKDYVESASGGRIRVNLLARDAIAPSDTEVLELVRAGEITSGPMSEDGASHVYPELTALAVPFMMPNAIVAEKMLAHDSPFFEHVAEEFYRRTNGEVRLVGSHVNSFRNLYSVHPIRVPDDLRRFNITIRVQEVPLTIAVWEALGASAIGLPSADRYMAMETGMINALEGGVASVYQFGIFDIAEYAILLGYMFSPKFYIVNEEWFQSLPPSLQQVAVDGWIKAYWMETQVREYFDLLELKNLQDDGNTVIIPSEEELAQWRDIAVPTARQYLEDSIDTSFIDYIQENVNRVLGDLNSMAETISRNF